MVIDVAETEGQEMGSGTSHKTDDEGAYKHTLYNQFKFINYYATVQLQMADSNAVLSNIVEFKQKMHYSSKGLMFSCNSFYYIQPYSYIISLSYKICWNDVS